MWKRAGVWEDGKTQEENPVQRALASGEWRAMPSDARRELRGSRRPSAGRPTKVGKDKSKKDGDGSETMPAAG